MEELALLVEWRGLVAAPVRERSRKTAAGPPCLGAGANVLDDGDAVWALDAGLDEDRRREGAAICARQGERVPAWWRGEYERRAGGAWDAFYKRHGDRAYSDRHWLDAAWGAAFARESGTVVEIGCGAGNALFPLLAARPGWRGVAVDFAPAALALLRARPDYDASRVDARVCDVSRDPLPVADGRADVVSCLFVLSAVEPASLAGVLAELRRALRVGGRVLFRDYGRYDEAQLRYKPGRKLATNFYVKQDGTRCFYFDVADVRAAFEAAGFTVAALDFVCRQDANRATRTRRRRVFVQGTFEKPPPP